MVFVLVSASLSLSESDPDNPSTPLIKGLAFVLKTLTSPNKEVRPFFLGDNSI